MILEVINDGKTYTYKTSNKLTLGKIKEITGKILNSDKKNLNFEDNDAFKGSDDTLLKDVIHKGENKAALALILDKEEPVIKEEEEIPKIIEPKKRTEKKKKNIKSIVEEIKKEPEPEPEHEPEKIIEIKNEKKERPRKRGIPNITDEKSIQLVSTVGEFNEKLQKSHDILFKKYMYDNRLGSNGLTYNYVNYHELNLFEKKITEYITKKVEKYKKLIKLLNKIKENITSQESFNAFYNEMLTDNSIKKDINVKIVNNCLVSAPNLKIMAGLGNDFNRPLIYERNKKGRNLTNKLSLPRANGEHQRKKAESADGNSEKNFKNKNYDENIEILKNNKNFLLEQKISEQEKRRLYLFEHLGIPNNLQVSQSPNKEKQLHKMNLISDNIQSEKNLGFFSNIKDINGKYKFSKKGGFLTKNYYKKYTSEEINKFISNCKEIFGINRENKMDKVNKKC